MAGQCKNFALLSDVDPEFLSGDPDQKLEVCMAQGCLTPIGTTKIPPFELCAAVSMILLPVTEWSLASCCTLLCSALRISFRDNGWK